MRLDFVRKGVKKIFEKNYTCFKLPVILSVLI